MKITVSAKSLAACLKAVLPAVATRPGLPILSSVRLDASDGGLNMEATDLELTVRRAMREVAVALGVVVVPAKALTKALASAGDREVQLESTTTEGRPRLDVRAGTRTVTLPGYATEEWPAVRRIAEITSVARRAEDHSDDRVGVGWPELDASERGLDRGLVILGGVRPTGSAHRG
jgi:DNA polymerase III subunit beta